MFSQIMLTYLVHQADGGAIKQNQAITLTGYNV